MITDPSTPLRTSLKIYPAMKDSGVAWLGEVPEHWGVRRMRNSAEMRVSNVDKHIKDNEIPVRLCNYIDVYKNDRIRERMPFMRGTATSDEIKRFRLQTDDVLITKDSEAWNDIGVPALVETTALDLICGYHLALLRPYKNQLYGKYLFRALQSPALSYQFHVEANGVTRYGLSHAAIKSIWLPLPPLPEQAAIVRFLDHYDRKIRRYIRAKQKLIKLLEEEKQAIIHRAVTRGLDPNVHLKPSGVEWLGDIPEHWGFNRGKFYFREVDVRSTTGQEELLSVSHITGVTPRSQKNINMFKAESYIGSKLCNPGQIAVNTMWAWMAAIGISRYHGIISSSYHIYEQIHLQRFNNDFLDLLLRSTPYKNLYRVNSTGITSSRLRLYPEDFLNIRFLCPPKKEQESIIAWVKETTRNLVAAIDSAREEIALLHEYRTRLIADVVTGKIDVREAAAALPAESEELEQIEEIEDQGDAEEDTEEAEIAMSSEEARIAD